MAKTGGGVAIQQGATVNGRGGRFASGGQLTDKQRQFVNAYVRNGGNGSAAAREAGYEYQRLDCAARDVLSRPHVQRAVFEARQKYISNELASVAAGTMHSLMVEESTPAATRYQAAKWCLEQAGHKNDDIKSLLDDGKSLSDMTIEELQAFINAGSGALHALEVQRLRTIDGQSERVDNAQDNAQSEDVVDVLG